MNWICGNRDKTETIIDDWYLQLTLEHKHICADTGTEIQKDVENTDSCNRKGYNCFWYRTAPTQFHFISRLDIFFLHLAKKQSIKIYIGLHEKDARKRVNSLLLISALNRFQLYNLVLFDNRFVYECLSAQSDGNESIFR